MTPEQFKELIALNGGNCWICQRELERPIIDHCHLTGQVRGILCFRCNSWLAAIESPLFSERAAFYLANNYIHTGTRTFKRNIKQFEALQRGRDRAYRRRAERLVGRTDITLPVRRQS